MKRRGHGEGTVYQRKDGRWTASLMVARHRYTWYGKSRREVQQKLQVAIIDHQQKKVLPGGQMRVEHFLQQWLASQMTMLRARTLERYTQLVNRHLLPVLGQLSLQQLTPQHLLTLYTQKTQEGLSPSTVNLLHTVLHRALKDAVRWNLLSTNVCDTVPPPKRARHEIRPLTIEQIQQFITAMHGHPLEPLFLLAITSGMRRGELLALHWSDLDLASGMLQVRRIFSRVPGNQYCEAEPKTAKSRRSIVLTTVAKEALQQLRSHQDTWKQVVGSAWQEQGLVFCRKDGKPLSPTFVIDQFKALLKQAGLPTIRFHDLRHSTASMLLALGVHPKVVQELLGHTTISITMDIYSHVLPSMQRDAMTQMNAVLGKS
ncbi:site-specific integrase [Reticulibacter mediterranei]|uniref:Site-specific integrase n=1 Tax=Reticulibacter mediterranei TaxID=2778369 RepID=A0A8J3N720_9CHLR|nr:tyrosine-type recombinase/integrase [Reticulibacter mediterranei]GHP00735.1 site-specific integrase [Reticulibacter mediterranei]